MEAEIGWGRGNRKEKETGTEKRKTSKDRQGVEWREIEEREGN